MRRVEAITGDGALAWVQAAGSEAREAPRRCCKAPARKSAQKIAQIMDNVRSARERAVAAASRSSRRAQGDDLAAQAVDVNGAKVLAASLEGADAKSLRETMDKLKDKLKSRGDRAGASNDGKVSLIAGVTAISPAKVKAGELVNYVASRSAAKAAAGPTWRRRAAPIRQAAAALDPSGHR